MRKVIDNILYHLNDEGLTQQDIKCAVLRDIFGMTHKLAVGFTNEDFEKFRDRFNYEGQEYGTGDMNGRIWYKDGSWSETEIDDDWSCVLLQRRKHPDIPEELINGPSEFPLPKTASFKSKLMEVMEANNLSFDDLLLSNFYIDEENKILNMKMKGRPIELHKEDYDLGCGFMSIYRFPNTLEITKEEIERYSDLLDFNFLVEGYNNITFHAFFKDGSTIIVREADEPGLILEHIKMDDRLDTIRNLFNIYGVSVLRKPDIRNHLEKMHKSLSCEPICKINEQLDVEQNGELHFDDILISLLNDLGYNKEDIITSSTTSGYHPDDEDYNFNVYRFNIVSQTDNEIDKYFEKLDFVFIPSKATHINFKMTFRDGTNLEMRYGLHFSQFFRKGLLE